MLVLGWADGFILSVVDLDFSVHATGKGYFVRHVPNHAQNKLG